VSASLETLLREREMRLVRRGDDNETEGIDRKQFIEVANDADIWIGEGSGVSRALQYRSQPQAWNCTNHRSMETAASESKSDQADIEHRALLAPTLNKEV
jgi:hypothetical protein